jgi:hypothetical protein
MMTVSDKNDARPNALEALHGVVENHRILLEEAFAERGSVSLLPAPVRNALLEILRASSVCSQKVD